MQQLTSIKIAQIIDTKIIGPNNISISEIITDSRKHELNRQKAFVALTGKRHNGHDYIEALYKKGLRCFIVSDYREAFHKLEGAAFIVCPDTLKALQKLGEYAGEEFRGKIIGITGSNGKTSVKEWLFHLLKFQKEIIRSPKSYNSQTGVPLSMLLLDNRYDTAIIEAGISLPGEMQKLEKIIRPQIGIFTGIGDAHRENFDSESQKIIEKLKLFKNCKLLIYNNKDELSDKLIQAELPNTAKFSWNGIDKNADLNIRFNNTEKGTDISARYQSKAHGFHIRQQDKASLNNIGHCLAYIFSQKLQKTIPAEAFKSLPDIEMRLEQIKGINNCTLINDSYNSDINSLSIALDLLKKQTAQKRKTLILSDIKQCRKQKDHLYQRVVEMIETAEIDTFIAVGPELSERRKWFSKITEAEFYSSTESFLGKIRDSDFQNEAILIKGAREFAFERISQRLQQKNHRTRLEINLEAFVHNLNFFKSKIPKDCRIMAMVKAFSYGSGTHQIAGLLQHEQIDYLAVAITDEGIRLRREGINLPVMVMNPEIAGLDALPEYNLEPEIYSFEILRALAEKIRMQTNIRLGIHLKTETGMNRLGFAENEIDRLIKELKGIKNIKIQSVFSHLAAADEPEHDQFTLEQIARFDRISQKIQTAFPYKILRHIANSSGTERFPEARFDMVRLGIGLYGFSPNNADKLQNVSSLISRISQIRRIQAGETVGYSRAGKVERDSRIAVVPIGYADGLRRSLSRGNWSFIVNGQKAPIVGNVCMDMCMIDITDIEASEGDEVIIFGDAQPADLMAEKLNTIPYEIITGIGDRVKRVYYY
jgi:alanine racemase